MDVDVDVVVSFKDQRGLDCQTSILTTTCARVEVDVSTTVVVTTVVDTGAVTVVDGVTVVVWIHGIVYVRVCVVDEGTTDLVA